MVDLLLWRNNLPDVEGFSYREAVVPLTTNLGLSKKTLGEQRWMVMCDDHLVPFQAAEGQIP